MRILCRFLTKLIWHLLVLFFLQWVEHQRRHLRLRYEEKQSPMTDERMQKLEELGFEWNGVTKSPLQGTPANNNK